MAASWNALSTRLRRLLFALTAKFIAIIEPIVYSVTGVYQQRKRISLGEEKEFTAELLHIVSKYPEAGWLSISVRSTVRLHSRFVRPDFVLQPHVKLMTYEDDTVYFAVCPPGENVYDLNKYPFYFFGLPECCMQLVAMPLSELPRLADKVGPPRCRISWVFHLTRCGSTALCQALHRVPGVTVLSESRFWLSCYSELMAKRGAAFRETDECRRLFDASVRLVLKDFEADTHLVVRAIGGCDHEFLLPYALENFPDSEFIHMYRDAEGVVKSMWRNMGHEVEEQFSVMQENSTSSTEAMHEYLKHIVVISCGLEEDVMECGADLSEARMLVSAWITNMEYLRKYGPKIGRLMTLCFDDFVTNQKSALIEVLDFLGLPQDSLPLALDGLAEDSQRGTILSKDVLSRAPTWQPDRETLDWCEAMCSKHSMPPFGQKFRLNGKLECIPLTSS